MLPLFLLSIFSMHHYIVTHKVQSRLMIYNWLFVAALFLIPCCGVGQEISGTVVDFRKEPVINATIQVFQSGVLKGGTISDFDGNYSIKPLDSGNYDVLVFKSGYVARHMKAVVVGKQEKVWLNFTLDSLKPGGKDTVVSTYKKSKVLVTAHQEQIHQTSGRVSIQTADLVALQPGVYQHKRESSEGATEHTQGNIYVVEGVNIRPDDDVKVIKAAKHRGWFRWLRRR